MQRLIARFFTGSPEQLVDNVAQAKREVALWLRRIGRQQFYSRLSEMQRGKSSDAIWID